MNQNLKQKFWNYGFLTSLASALFLIVQAIAKACGLVISEESYMTIVNAVLSCLVLLGFITKPASSPPTIEVSEASDQVETAENENELDKGKTE